jgi:hypothetical protein
MPRKSKRNAKVLLGVNGSPGKGIILLNIMHK